MIASIGYRARSRRVALLMAFVLATSACGGSDDVAETSDTHRYELVGDVVSVDSEQGTVTLEHQPVADFMGVMTMPFNVREQWVLGAVVPGAQVKATLVVSGTASWLEDVSVRTPASEGAAAEAVIPAPDPGSEVPSIDLIDQSGAPLSLASYQGQYFAYTFIYTRCPLPDFCPKMSELFDEIHIAVGADPERYGGLKLLSLSIDPEFDTPEVLSDYARRYLPGTDPDTFERWRFATSTPTSLHDLGEFSGIRYRPDSGEFVHSLRTILVGPDGRVIAAFVGNSWDAADLLAALESTLTEAGQ